MHGPSTDSDLGSCITIIMLTASIVSFERIPNHVATYITTSVDKCTYTPT